MSSDLCSDQLHWVLAAFTVLLAIGLKSWLSRQEKVEQAKRWRRIQRQESPRELQFQGGDHQTIAPLLEIPPGGTAVAPEIRLMTRVARVEGMGPSEDPVKTAVNTSEALVNSSEIQNTKEVEISLASETNSLKESKEIDLPAAGDKYPLGSGQAPWLVFVP